MSNRCEKHEPEGHAAPSALSKGRSRPVVYLISGPPGAGTPAVAHLTAARAERGVHLDGDVFRRSIVGGREEITPDASPEACEQLRLGCRLAASAADGYVAAGFTVALEDGPAAPLLGDYRTMIRSRPCHIIVLLPSINAIAARDAERRENRATNETLEQQYERFVKSTPRAGIWLDTSDLTTEQTVDAILARTPSRRTPVVVTSYDSTWPALFEELAGPVRDAMGDLAAAVEHVGSTSVPGLAAKPVIDIDVVLHSAQDIPMAIEHLRALGYVYQGDKGIAGREAFLWPPGAPPHHLYLVAEGSAPHADHVDFRDYLRQHPEVAQEYASLKQALAARHTNNRSSYTESKAKFIADVLAAARA